LPDFWEEIQFQNTDQRGNGDFDGDGFSNLQEFQNITDPNEYVIKLNNGWNLISISRVPADNTIVTIFQDKMISATVWTWQDGHFVNATHIEPLKGYWIYGLCKKAHQFRLTSITDCK
jgi:hypothetical protein